MSNQQSSRRAGFRWWPIAACLACYVAAFVATHLPPRRVPSGIMFNDKIAHVTGFFALGAVTAAALRPRRERRFAATIWLSMMAYAAFDEITQPFVGRSFEWGDLAADGLGAAVGIVIVSWIAIMRR